MLFVLNVGIILSLFFGVTLLTKKQKLLADKLLSAWLIIIGLHLLSYFTHIQGYWETYPHLVGITAPFPLLHGPLMFLYVEYSQRNRKQLAFIDWLHLLPVTLAYVYMLPFLFTYSAAEKAQVDAGLVDDYSLFSIVLLIASIASGISYTVIAYVRLLRRRALISNNFSYREGIEMLWLRNAIIFIGSVFLTAALVVSLRGIVGVELPFNGDFIFYSIVVIFVAYVGYFGIKQQGLFSDNSDQELALVPSESEPSYKNSGLKPEVAQVKHQELHQLMESEKPYLNPKLTLSELASQLAITSNHLSQIINQYEQVNFHDFVNAYRINEFIERAEVNKHFSLLALALDSGFNSKSSFNTIFKKVKDCTPSEYMARLAN